MLKIDKKILAYLIKISIQMIIILSFVASDFAQERQTPLNIYNTPVASNIYELIDFGRSHLMTSNGIASYYGGKFHMRKTSNGERFNKNNHSAAHRNLPFGTILRVTNEKNSKSTLVRINDRGPFIKKRIIDLSTAAARDIDGLGLPIVEISGFNPKKLNIEYPENYFLAYSITDNPAIYTKEIFDVIDEYKDFQNVFEDYQFLLESNPSFENNLFILIAADDYLTKASKVTYKLGYFNNFEPKRIPFNIAERDKK